MPPEEKLKHFDSQAQAHEDNQEVGTVYAASRSLYYSQCYFASSFMQASFLFTSLMHIHELYKMYAPY